VFEESDLKWATRWDPLLEASPEDRRVQWFSIINSILITLVLSILVAVVLMRTVYLDFARYNGISDDEDISMESGWKLLHGDVFRAPQFGEFLCALVGSGIQLLIILGSTLLFAVLGFISPANRGSLISMMLFFWVLSSFVCGMSSATLYLNLRGTKRRTNSGLSAFLLSGMLASVFMSLNLILRMIGSVNAVPFFSMLLLISIWFGISVPLNLLGSYFGFLRTPHEMPAKTHTIPREVPDQSLLKDLAFVFIPGLAPFCIAMVQLVFILNSIWHGSIFHMFGFLSIVAFLLSLACAEVGVCSTYMKLIQLDYRWWWFAFLSAGSSGLYLMLYSISFFLQSRAYQIGENGGIVSALIFFSYTSLISICFTIFSGSISFIAAYWFVYRMYASIRL